MVISGNARLWAKGLVAEAFGRLYCEGELYQQEYREAIWRSKINLSFITHSNQDEFVHKSFEIAGVRRIFVGGAVGGAYAAVSRGRRGGVLFIV